MKRFSKIFAIALVITMLASVFCFPSSAVIADSSIDVSVSLDKVTTVGEISCDDTGLDATELGNIYKVTLSYKVANAALQRFQAAVVYDDTLFDVCYGSGNGAENFIAYPVGDGSEFGFTAACKFLDTVGFNDAYDANGVGGQTSSLKIKAYGLSHASAGTTFVAEKMDPASEAYGTAVNGAYPGEAVPANRGAVISSFTISTSVAKNLIIPTGDEDFVSIYLMLKDGKTDIDVANTELRVSLIDYSATAYSNCTMHGTMYGMPKTATPDTVASCTANGLKYTFKAPSPVYEKTSQIRYNSAETDGKGSANFDVRTRAAMTAENFAAICGTDVEAKTAITKVGFVYADSSVGLTLDNAAKVIGGTAVDGYVDVPVQHIQKTASEYVWTCLITYEDGMYDDAVDSVGYIVVDGTTYYFDAVYATDFSTLYDAQSSHLPTA